MNLSSIILNIEPDKAEEIKIKLEKSSVCEAFLHKDTKIIITIKGKNKEEEIFKLRQIEAIDGVISSSFIYSDWVDKKNNSYTNYLDSFPGWLWSKLALSK